MAIYTTDLPQVSGFASANDFLINGPDGTGRLSGEAAKDFFANYFEYPLYNYEGVNLGVKFAAEIANYSDFAAWLRARLAAKNLSGIHIKDYFQFTTSNNVTFKARIADINHDLGFADSEITKWHTDFICDEVWPDNHVWNKVSYNNGLSEEKSPWCASDLKRFLNSESGSVPNGTGADPATVAVDYASTGVYDKLPAALKAVIIERRSLEPVRYTTGSLLTDDNSWEWKNIGKLWVPNETEVYGQIVWGTRNGYAVGETHQFPIFRDGKMRIKRKSGSRANWWLRSAYSGNSAFAEVVCSDGYADRYAASLTGISVPVCFRVSA